MLAGATNLEARRHVLPQARGLEQIAAATIGGDMTDAPVLSPLECVPTRPADPAYRRRRGSSAATLVAVPTRAHELPCECGRANCRATLPRVAETHRGTAQHLIMAPEHYVAGTVVRAADQFFVVARKDGAALLPLPTPTQPHAA
jgi:hypothetical protein